MIYEAETEVGPKRSTGVGDYYIYIMKNSIEMWFKRQFNDMCM